MFRSLSYIQILDNTDESKDILNKLLIAALEMHQSNYLDLEVDELFLRYILIKDKNIPITINNHPRDLNPSKIFDTGELDLPRTMNLEE